MTASPAAPVFGQAVTLDATVSVVSPGTGVPTGTVTFEEGSTTLGTATLIDGVAELSTTPSAAGSRDDHGRLWRRRERSAQQRRVPPDGRPGRGDAQSQQPELHLRRLTPHRRRHHQPRGTLGRHASPMPRTAWPWPTRPRPGDYTVTATLDNPNYTAPAATGTLVIGQATPTLTWADPANITAGTPLGAAQLDAIASFDGMPLPGVLTYTPPAGTVLPAGNGQTLTVSFTPTDGTDFKTVTSSVPINVLPQSTPPPPHAMVISEQPVFQRKLNKNGKPVGKAVLTGFTLDFNMPLDAAAVSNPGNYQLDTVTTKKVKKKLDRVLHPIKSFTVTYTPASDSVTLKLAGTQSFPTGGQITVLPGVTSASGSVLSGTTVFTITPGGKTIEPS